MSQEMVLTKGDAVTRPPGPRGCGGLLAGQDEAPHGILPRYPQAKETPGQTPRSSPGHVQHGVEEHRTSEGVGGEAQLQVQRAHERGGKGHDRHRQQGQPH